MIWFGRNWTRSEMLKAHVRGRHVFVALLQSIPAGETMLRRLWIWFAPCTVLGLE